MAKKIDPITGELIEDDGFEQEFFGNIDQDESGGVQQGPTPEMPFKFTEQALNPRAEAATGMSQRDPRARSAFTGLTPGAFGQQEVSEEDTNYAMGKMFGLGKSKVDEAMNPNFFMPGGDWAFNQALGRSREDMQARPREQRMLERDIVRGNVKIGDLTPEQQTQYEGVQGKFLAGGLSDEQRMFRTFQAMDPEAQAKVNFGDPRFMKAMMKVGNNSAQFFDKFSSMSANKQRGRVQDSQSSKSGGNLMSRIGKVVTLAGVAAITGGAVGGMLAAPVAAGGAGFGGAAAGAAGGAAGGFTSAGMNQMIAGEFNPQGLATSTALGAAGGAVAGGVLSGSGGATYQGPDAGGLTGTAGAPTAQGGILNTLKNTYNTTKDFLATPGGGVLKAMGKAGAGEGFSALSAEGIPEGPEVTGLSSNMFSAQSQGIGGQSRFQRKPDDPFYQAPTDLESAQGDLV